MYTYSAFSAPTPQNRQSIFTVPFRGRLCVRVCSIERGVFPFSAPNDVCLGKRSVSKKEEKSPGSLPTPRGLGSGFRKHSSVRLRLYRRMERVKRKAARRRRMILVWCDVWYGSYICVCMYKGTHKRSSAAASTLWPVLSFDLRKSCRGPVQFILFYDVKRSPNRAVVLSSIYSFHISFRETSFFYKGLSKFYNIYWIIYWSASSSSCCLSNLFLRLQFCQKDLQIRKLKVKIINKDFLYCHKSSR